MAKDDAILFIWIGGTIVACCYFGLCMGVGVGLLAGGAVGLVVAGIAAVAEMEDM